MWITLLGLILDVLGASLLIWGELQGNAAMLNYLATGTQMEEKSFQRQLDQYWWWKRWPLKLGVQWGSRRHLGQEALFDSFPFTAWGLFLLIVGFILQGGGVFCSR
jgi:hypothetical protein